MAGVNPLAAQQATALSGSDPSRTLYNPDDLLKVRTAINRLAGNRLLDPSSDDYKSSMADLVTTLGKPFATSLAADLQGFNQRAENLKNTGAQRILSYYDQGGRHANPMVRNLFTQLNAVGQGPLPGAIDSRDVLERNAVGDKILPKQPAVKADTSNLKAP